MYCAIIADIIDSKHLDKRDEIQKKLNDILSNINATYKRSLASKFTITIGDEFQGLLDNPLNLFEIIDRIRISMYPVQLRIGIGFGEIYTDINPEIAIGADGPAYYLARESVDCIKKNSLKNGKAFFQTEIRATKDIQALGIINSSLSLGDLLVFGWTEKHLSVIKLLSDKDYTQNELANLLNVSQSTIQRRLDGASYANFIYQRKTLQKYINTIWEELNG